jgi:hypothetical protein
VRHVEAYSRLAGVYDEIVIDPCHDRWAAFLYTHRPADASTLRAIWTARRLPTLGVRVRRRSPRSGTVDAAGVDIARSREGE